MLETAAIDRPNDCDTVLICSDPAVTILDDVHTRHAGQLDNDSNLIARRHARISFVIGRSAPGTVPVHRPGNVSPAGVGGIFQALIAIGEAALDAALQVGQSVFDGNGDGGSVRTFQDRRLVHTAA